MASRASRLPLFVIFKPNPTQFSAVQHPKMRP
jgi:hypothetical protein